MKYYTLLIALLLITLGMRAQGEMTVDWNTIGQDSIVPVFSHSIPLGSDYAESYDVRIEYPELEPVPAHASYYDALRTAAIGDWPEVATYVGVARKQGQLDISFIPIILRDSKYWRIKSFDLKVNGRSSESKDVLAQSLPSRDGRRAKLNGATSQQVNGSTSQRGNKSTSRRRAASLAHSVLATGRWMRVDVAKDGLYLLTPKSLSAMGFKEPDKVRVFGYGGHLLPEYDLEKLPEDLPQVPVFRNEDGGILFWGNGTVSYSRKADGTYNHVQNYYATTGCYFLTETSDSIRWDDLVASNAEELVPVEFRSAGTLCVVEENDAYAFHPSGRKLFDSYDFANGASHTWNIELPCFKEGGEATVTVAFAHDGAASTALTVKAGETNLGTMTISGKSAYCDGSVAEATYKTTALSPTTTAEKSTVRLTLTHDRPSGVSGRLDYIRISYPSTAGYYTTEEIHGGTLVANQDLRSTPPTDYIIVVPSSGALTAQAERLAEAHRKRDGLSVLVVSADQIYNEFSSGTRDATAIRRFLKMLYDRATNDSEMPRYLLLFGDGAWDNRMLSDNWRGSSPDDYLPCFESVESFSATRSFVMEDYFGLLDDGEGRDLLRDKPDVGVGRFPVVTVQQAREAVDKTIAYMENVAAGAWKNTILMLGDDGDNNQHMRDAEYVVRMLEGLYPKYMYKRIYWDTFPMEITATGNSYPAVHKRILELLDEGALMVNYSGHGRADVLSHELVLDQGDMAALTSPRLPLWVTASCDISPFDHTGSSFGEYAFLNPKGGAIALFTTTRTVFSSYNRRINYLFSKYVFGRDSSGRPLRLGDAVRIAKTEVVSTTDSSLQDISENKLHYILLGDPALRIACTDYEAVIDKLNGSPFMDNGSLALSAGAVVTAEGHIVDGSGEKATNFSGTVHPTVLDNRETVFGRNNNGSASEPFSYTERSNVLFSGSDSVRNGSFRFTFRVPMDINYSGESGELNIYAINDAKNAEAQGYTEAFLLGGTHEGLVNDSTGPSLSLYLNTPSFVSGDKVNETPLLVATLEDADGINTVGGGIGHDIVAVIDGSAALTYKLNNYYVSDFGDYTRGTLAYSLPTLPDGHHSLLLRAWDMMNNSSTATLDFEVVAGLKPSLTDVTVTDNPARTTTTFVVTHDRPETAVTFRIDVFDFSGRILWSNEETTATSSNLYTCSWNLCNASGTPLSMGVYLYRVTVSSATGSSTSQSRKLVIK